MTNVQISHNPFLSETEIIVDDNRIAETSRLHKYIKTPMQDWVGNFLPMLVEHCNDDELSIEFKGLLHNYEELKSALEIFRHKNRDYEIELRYQYSQRLTDRLAECDAIMAEMKKQDAIPRELLNSLSQKHNTVLQVLIFGRDERRRCELSDCLTSAYKEFNKMEIHQISELESVKQAIESEDKPILVCMVDEHSSEKENAKIINLISDAYKVRGKINKWRYIFVADSPLYAKRILSSDFAIKNADVYGTDVPDAICQRIDAYRSEFWQIRKLADFSVDLIYRLAILKQRLTVQAEQDKPIGRINELEKKAIKIVNSCWLSYRCDRTSFEKGIDQRFEQLQTDFKNRCLINSNGQHFTDIQVKNNVDIYIDKFSSLVRSLLQHQSQGFRYMPMVEMREDGNTKKHMELLAQFGCHTLLQYIRSHSQLSCETFELRVFPSIEVTISSKEKSTIVISAENINRSTGLFASVYPGQSFARMCIHYRPQNNDYPRHNKAKYDLYTGIKAQICSVFSKNSQQLTKEQVTNCAQIFNREIERFREVFVENLNACISQGKKEFEQLIPDFEAMKTKAIEDIKIKAEEMRENAQISEEQKWRLESIQRLLDRADALTKI